MSSSSSEKNLLIQQGSAWEYAKDDELDYLDDLEVKGNDREGVPGDVSSGLDAYSKQLVSPITGALRAKPPLVTTVFIATFSFSAYLCVYGFRKPWTAASWTEQDTLFGFQDPKLFLDWTQLIGYVIGKASGIFIIPTIPGHFRFPLLVSLPIVSTFFWLMLGLLHNLSTVAVFLVFFFSTMPLSLAWSLMYRYLEGRHHPDVLGAVLSSAIVVGSSLAKTIGYSLLDTGLSEYWMPFAAALCYLLPYMVCAILIHACPDPSPEERKVMSERRPISQREKAQFLGRHWIGLVALTAGYVLLTSCRDFRDTFTVEIFDSVLGHEPSSGLLLLDVPVGILVCMIYLSLAFIKDHALNVAVEHAIMFVGYFCLLFFQTLFWFDLIPVPLWFVGCGVGVYLAYTPVSAMLYDRIGAAIAHKEDVGTATFMIQVSDFSGYIGTLLLYSLQGFGALGGDTEIDSNGEGGLDYYTLYTFLSLGVGVVGMVGTLISGVYWQFTLRKKLH